MRNIFLLLLIFISVNVFGQSYNPSTFTVSNKPYGINAAASTDARSMYYDGTNFTYRPYQNAAEALSYLNLPKYRTGSFPIIINSGGTLSGGLITGGINTLYYFKNGTADSNLVAMIPVLDLSTVLLRANNLSDLTNVISARTNLGLGTMATANSSAPSGDVTGDWKIGLTVSQLNGLPPSYYLNYSNLTGKPTIPAQLNPTGAGNISITGVYPNLIFTGSYTGFEQSIFTLNTTSQNDSINIGSSRFKFQGTSSLGIPTGTTAQRPSGAATGDFRFNTDSSKFEAYNGSSWFTVTGTGGGGGGSGITALTGDGTASGTGSVPFTLATVNSNVFGSNTFLKFTVNGKGLVTAATGVTSGDITTALGFTPYNSTNPSGYISVVNLGYTQGATTNTVTNSAGTTAVFQKATTSLAGLLDTARARFIDSMSNNLSGPNIDAVLSKGGRLTAARSFSGGNNLVTWDSAAIRMNLISGGVLQKIYMPNISSVVSGKIQQIFPSYQADTMYAPFETSIGGSDNGNNTHDNVLKGKGFNIDGNYNANHMGAWDALEQNYLSTHMIEWHHESYYYPGLGEERWNSSYFLPNHSVGYGTSNAQTLKLATLDRQYGFTSMSWNNLSGLSGAGHYVDTFGYYHGTYNADSVAVTFGANSSNGQFAFTPSSAPSIGSQLIASNWNYINLAGVLIYNGYTGSQSFIEPYDAAIGTSDNTKSLNDYTNRIKLGYFNGLNASHLFAGNLSAWGRSTGNYLLDMLPFDTVHTNIAYVLYNSNSGNPNTGFYNDGSMFMWKDGVGFDSIGTATGGYLFRDASTGKIRLTQGGGGGGGGSTTNLGAIQNATTYTITSSTGSSANLLIATSSLAGLFDTASKKYVDSLRAGLKDKNIYFANVGNSGYNNLWANNDTIKISKSIAGFGMGINKGLDSANTYFIDTITYSFHTTQYYNTIYQATLPSQTGNSGKFLTTNGTTVSWAVASNIYNTDGTLTGNRTITNNGNSLTITGTGITTFFGGNYNNSLGSQFAMGTSSINNGVTAASGTVVDFAADLAGHPTLTASNTGVIYTNASTFYIDNAPTASTNVTITNPWALKVAAGNTYLGGKLMVANNDTAATASGGCIFRDAATGQYKLTACSGSATATIYSGDGSLSGDRTISGSHYLQFVNGIFNGVGIGSQALFGALTLGNTTTSASGTVTDVSQVGISPVTFSATNSNVTYTNGSSLLINGAPIAGTNITITNAWALKVAAGNSTFGGDVIAKRFVSTMPTAITAATTTTVDLSTGNMFQINLGANITTLTLNNPKTGTYIIKFLQDGTGGRTVALPGGWKWAGGTVPTITSTLNKADIVTLVYDGATYYASIIQNF